MRSSYDSRNQANVHLLVQQYGKGKSHFAVAIANYFSKPAGSVEVEGILRKIENSAGENSVIAQRLRSYKKYGKHLVLCLSGDRAGDIGKQFLQSLLKALETEGITDSIAQHICSEPLNYLLQKVYANPRERDRAEAYLDSIGSPDGDLDSITQQLRKSNPAVIPTLRDLARHLVGFVPDWNVNIDLEAILKDLLTTHCSGENPRFQGILILFDELNFYLQSWARDPIGAGGTALQNITNICENYKSKIALLSFTQIDPAKGVGISAGALEDHKRLVSRLAPKGSTYEKVASSLELVLDNLILQKDDSPEWKAFRATWNNVLLAETNNAYEKRIAIYRQKGWTRDRFHSTLTIGCFPLHPLTSYLLCNLAFTQDRTALQFVKKNVKDFIQNQLLETQDQLNWIRPISLIDTFLENFSDDSNYSKYKEAEVALAGSDDPNELLVVKALFLFHASDRLTKTDRESHEEILETLTGLSGAKVKAALHELTKSRDIIFYKPEVKLYRFWTGVAPTGIEEEIREEIERKKLVPSINDVVALCNSSCEKFLGSKTLAAKHFVDTSKLVLEDWQFEYRVYPIDGFIRALANEQTLKQTEQRGILAYVVGETQADLQDFRRQVDTLLAKSPIRDRIAVAIPSYEASELATVLLKIKTLKNKEVAERRSLGQAYEELLNRWLGQVSTQAGNLLKSCTYHCVGIEKLPPAKQEEPQRVISLLLENLYPFVPPIEGIDKLRSDHKTGREVIGSVSQRLLAENLTTPLGKTSIYSFVDPVFVNRWRLLKKTSQRYSAQEPTHERIKAAWDVISKMADLGEQPEKIIDLQKVWKALSQPPYGYSEYNFTMLLAGWLSYHRKEVSLRGDETIPSAGRRGATSVSTVTKSLKDWSETNILEKPDEFVKKWIITGNAKLVRRKRVLPPSQPQSSINYSRAEQYLLEVSTYLGSGEPDPTEISAVTKNRDQVYAGVTQIKEWFQPVEAAEELAEAAPLESLLEVYPKLLLAPPALVFRDDFISVQPTPQQRDRQAQASQTVSEKIEQLVNEQSERSETLTTEEACGAYKGEIRRLLNRMTQVASLPPHLTDALNYSLQAVDRRQLELKESAKVRDCLSQIQNRYKSLGNSPMQQDYLSTREAIETLAQTAPSVKQDEAYEQILQELDQRLNDLTRQVEIWEEQSLGLDSPDQIQELIGEVRDRRYRFTEDESTQKVNKLLEYLKRELTTGQSKDDAVKNIKVTLSNANRKLERIRDVAANKLPEAFESYQELVVISLPSVDLSIPLGEYQQELEGFKAKGRSALISEGFAKVYSLDLKRLEDYTQLKTRLQQLLDFIVAREDFTDVKTSLEQALQALETRHTELQQKQQEQKRKAADDEIIRSIRGKYKLPKTNTIQFLEDGIGEIQSYQSRLYEAEPFASEIEQIANALQDRIANHSRTLEALRERLISIVTLKDLEQVQTEHIRLDFTFKDSSQYSIYQSLQQQFEHLKGDLETLQILEIRSQQAVSIAHCHQALAALNNDQSTLHYPERFQQKLTELRNTLQHKVQTYTQELDDFEHRLEHATMAKEAQKIREDLLKQSTLYAESELSDRYEAISTNLRLLSELFQISETENIRNLEACQSQLEKLTQWKENIYVLVPLLQKQFDAVHEAIRQTEIRLLQRQQGDAEGWLKKLESQAAELQSLTDETEKSKLADKLLQKIQREQTQYIDRLNAVYQDSLRSIERQCEIEIDRDRENQVKILFQQLPRSQRVTLHRQLEQYLSDPTEEFNG